MVDSILSLWTETNEALKVIGDRQYCLSEDDRIVLEQLRRFLKPFYELTELVSKEEPHLGLIPLIIREIKDAALHSPDDCDAIKDLKDAVRNRVDFRIRITDAVRIASLLDPTMKSFILTSPDLTIDEAENLLCSNTRKAVDRKQLIASSSSCDSAVGDASSSSTSMAFVPSAPAASSSKKQKLMEKFRNADRSNSGDLDLCIRREVNTYLHAEVDNPGGSALQFWQKHVEFYPNLSVLAKNYLSISSSSVPVETMFSTCGLLLNSKRMSMAPFRANLVSMIHDNYPKYFPVSRIAATAASADL
jgi:hypothetical protein